MPVISNYSTLVSAVIEFAEDDSVEFLNYIPTAIDLAEQKMIKEFDTLGMTLETTVAASVGVNLVTKPSSFREGYDLVFEDASTGSYTVLDHKTKSFIYDYWPVSASVGVPKYYADSTNREVKLAPTPDKAYNLTFTYSGRPDPLTSANPTNYFTDYTGDALFYGTLVHMAPFMRHYQMLIAVKGLYDESVESLVNEGRRQRRDSGDVPNNPEGGTNAIIERSK